MEDERIKVTEQNKESEVIGVDISDSGTEKANISAAGLRAMYAVAAVLTPIFGMLFGVLSAFCIAVGNMTDAEEAPKDFADVWYVDFVSKNGSADFVSEGIIRLVALGILFVAGVVVLCILSGRFGRKEDENGVIPGPEGVNLNWFDRMWTELNLIIFALACTGAVCIAFPIVQIMPVSDMFLKVYKPLNPNAYFYGISNNSIMILCALGMLACIEIAILCLVSFVKKCKARKCLETSMVVIVIKMIINWIEGVDQKLSAVSVDKNAGRKLTWKYLLIIIALIIISTICMPVGLIIAIILAFYFVPKKITSFMEIRRGVEEVKNGDLTYKIPFNENENGPVNELDRLAADINQISQSTNQAVQNELKNQRMKTDLISNVSHDLKTPLTSMLSYVDILKKEGLDSPKAQEYLAIIDEKTRRLKTLTEDLFEAAKASSGNIPCELTEIDINSLITQELAEMSDSLDKNKLKVIKTCKTEELKVMADGRHLSRVIENVLGNVSKYALPKSRVYIDISETKTDRKQILLEVKNISKEQLNISTDELMERFTRGDDSRNTDGSGLGLAIAKDLTRMMGGEFEISIDGDMFKASIKLDRA